MINYITIWRLQREERGEPRTESSLFNKSSWISHSTDNRQLFPFFFFNEKGHNATIHTHINYSPSKLLLIWLPSLAFVERRISVYPSAVVTDSILVYIYIYIYGEEKKEGKRSLSNYKREAWRRQARIHPFAVWMCIYMADLQRRKRRERKVGIDLMPYRDARKRKRERERDVRNMVGPLQTIVGWCCACLAPDFFGAPCWRWRLFCYDFIIALSLFLFAVIPFLLKKTWTDRLAFTSAKSKTSKTNNRKGTTVSWRSVNECAIID